MKFILKHLCSHDKWSLAGHGMLDYKEIHTNATDNINNAAPVKMQNGVMYKEIYLPTHYA